MSKSNRKSGNKYQNLISNTIIFGISTFGSKVLVFLLLPFYTRVLDPDAMGTTQLITSTCNLILPIMYLCIAESVIRFGMEDDYRRSDVLSVGIYTVLAGYAVLLCTAPLLQKIEALSGYTWLVLLYCLTSALRTVITNFIRATGLVRLFALDGILTTITNIGFSVLFLLVFDLGIAGYVLGIVVSDGLSALSLFLLVRLHRFLKIRNIDKTTAHDMLRYALPLIPTAVSWWITNLSDQYFVRYLSGEYQLGLYTMAYKIPNMITLVSAFFTRAWELSAFTEYRSKEGERFFSNVFRSYYTFIFLAASGLILLIQPLTRLIMAPAYFPSWEYSLFLLLAVSFSCLVTFLGAIYNAARKNIMVSVTTFTGAAINIALNVALIPKFGPQGAAFATFISFFSVFLIRAVDTRRYIKIHMQGWRIALCLLLLLAQVWVALSQSRFWILWECLIFAAILAVNLRYLLFLLLRVLEMITTKRRAK